MVVLGLLKSGQTVIGTLEENVGRIEKALFISHNAMSGEEGKIEVMMESFFGPLASGFGVIDTVDVMCMANPTPDVVQMYCNLLDQPSPKATVLRLAGTE